MIKTSTTAALDTLRWLPEKSGSYSVKTGYGIGITTGRLGSLDNEPVNWLQRIWNVKKSSKLKVFLWRVVKKAIPVSSNLEKRGVPSFN